MKKRFTFLILLGSIVLHVQIKAQEHIQQHISYSKPQNQDSITSQAPETITRNIIQDRKGNIWMASFDGIFKYDGQVFTKITSKLTSARFFSVLEDRKGHLWFGTIGSGVYRYDGKSFQNFTTKDGLANNEVGSIYEDKIGNIWFGVNGGVSNYNGNIFRNFLMTGQTMQEDLIGTKIPDFTRPPNEVTAIVEDKNGHFWFTTRGNTYVYDGITFSIVRHDDQVFSNIRTIINDKKGNIWLGGADGLWRKEGEKFINLSKNFVGYIYEDHKGNIWTSSQLVTSQGWIKDWLLIRYDSNTLKSPSPITTEITSDYNHIKGMIFGILEANDGTIWFGALDGVYRYDGKNILDAKGGVVKD